MSIKKISKEQPKNFKFNEKNLELVNKIKQNYPNGKEKSAVMPLLYLAQKQNDNWIPLEAMKYIAKLINIPYIKVYEVATFYTMYNLSPVGKYHVQICTTTPCMIRGAYDLVDVLKKKINENQNELSEKGICSWTEVECLGACINAPMMQINDDYYEDLNVSDVEKIIEKIMNNEKPLPGSYKGRKNSEPVNNRKTLINNKNA
jgi:NADH-quinone oxidoreductase E subunit|tara:strand:+ start:234 stop:842 length:609 start_codon:yes stop_codon:yes gene_type:complete